MRNIKGGKRKKLTCEAIFVYRSPRPRQGCYGRESRAVASAERTCSAPNETAIANRSSRYSWLFVVRPIIIVQCYMDPAIAPAAIPNFLLSATDTFKWSASFSKVVSLVLFSCKVTKTGMYKESAPKWRICYFSICWQAELEASKVICKV